MVRKNLKTKDLKGFSLLEIILTLGLLLLISALTFPTTLGNVQRSKIKGYASQIASDIYYQQQRAKSKNISTGIYFTNGRYYLFDGDSFDTGTEKDEKVLPKNTYISSTTLTTDNSILFPNDSFKPVSFGNIYIGIGSQSVKVSINEEGLIEYD